MAIPITIPRLGWNMEQGVFVGWLKADGAKVRSGDSLFTLESDKATEDVECLDDGVLHIPANAPRKGDVVLVGAVIGFVLQSGEPIPRAGDSPAEPVPLEKAAPSEHAPVGISLTVPSGQGDRPSSTPRARRAAAKL